MILIVFLAILDLVVVAAITAIWGIYIGVRSLVRASRRVPEEDRSV